MAAFFVAVETLKFFLETAVGMKILASGKLIIYFIVYSSYRLMRRASVSGSPVGFISVSLYRC